MFQINEDDLRTLEREIPTMAGAIVPQFGLDNAMRVRLRSVQKILSDIRWDYGPHTNIEHIPAKDGGQ